MKKLRLRWSNSDIVTRLVSCGDDSQSREPDPRIQTLRLFIVPLNVTSSCFLGSSSDTSYLSSCLTLGFSHTDKRSVTWSKPGSLIPFWFGKCYCVCLGELPHLLPFPELDSSVRNESKCHCPCGPFWNKCCRYSRFPIACVFLCCFGASACELLETETGPHFTHLVLKN